MRQVELVVAPICVAKVINFLSNPHAASLMSDLEIRAIKQAEARYQSTRNAFVSDKKMKLVS